MITIYQSNCIDILERLMEFIIQKETLDSPFEPEIVLAPSFGMKKWLQISLAEKFGVAGNIKFPLLTNFIWDVFVCVLPNVPEQSFLNKKALAWKLMTLLPNLLQQNKYTALQCYLNDSNDKQKLFQFSSYMAELYDRYSIYRPYWLTSWEAGEQIEGLSEEQIWQASLWKSLVEHTIQLGQPCSHRANLYEHLIRALKSKPKPSYVLPTRVFIFCISSLPPMYLKILEALSKHIDIHILLVNPCRYYWGDTKHGDWLMQSLANQRLCLGSEENKSLVTKCSNSTRLFKEDIAENLSNPLLGSWGKLGSDYIQMLSDIAESEKRSIEGFVEIKPGCLLHNLQRDILELENNTIENSQAKKQIQSDNRYCLNPEDRSVVVHVCHSAQREVEVLHDNLLAMLDSDSDLNLRDIAIMVSDIDKYTPFIQGVFGSATDERYLPYEISDCRMKKSHSILETFITLLSLPENRFLSEDVLALLDTPALAARFNIDEEGVCYLRQWVKESGIRWGIDDDNVQEFSLPTTGQHTWKFGLTRMLLGYAMESTKGEWNEILPYDDCSGMISELAGNLSSLLMYLNYWKKNLMHEKKLDSWLFVCRDLLHDFFIPHQEIEKEIDLIEKQWRLLIEEGIRANHNGFVPLSLLRNEFALRLNQVRSTKHLITGSLNISTLTSMRSIPFKVICLIGMNDGVYPRSIVQLDFDLIAQKPQRGDYDLRHDDRYVFLEALISAKKKLYISYIGCSIQNNKKRFPSVLVQELMDYIGRSHYLLGNKSQNYEESEQHVKSHITFFHSRMPFDPINYHENERQSYVREWLPTARKEEKFHSNFIQELDDFSISTLDFEQFQYFWMHPVRAFFQIRLGVNFRSEVSEIPSTEPFTLDTLSQYQLNKKLLQSLLEGKEEKLFCYYRAAGKLPYGAFGEIIWDTHRKEMQVLASNIMKRRKKTTNHEINLKCKDIQLIGWLHNVQPDGILRWHSGIPTVSQGMKLWLEHLVYCACGGTGESLLLSRKNKKWHFLSLKKKQALYYLSQLVEGYKRGMKKPLLFLPESSGAWMQVCYDTKNHRILMNEETMQKARNRFLKIYKGNVMAIGEGSDIWYQQLRCTPDSKHFDAIIKEAKRYLFPLYRFNQHK